MFGKKLGDYELLQPINRGGMASVFKAKRIFDGKIFALRIMLPEIEPTPKAVREFVGGCKLALELDHPNIQKVYEVNTSSDPPYVCLEYIEGDNLKQAILRNSDSMTISPLKAIIRIAEGISYLHSNNIIHRDIKPENILVAGRSHVHIADFGLAILKNGLEVVTKTIAGSPSYLAPEVINERKYSDATDIYSFGVTTYEIMTRRTPYAGADDHKIMQQHIDSIIKPRSIRDLNPTIPEKIEKTVMKLIEKDPAKRYPDINLFIRDFKAQTNRF
jgi:eukaryotic-like serine/threonine-protein kinase